MFLKANPERGKGEKEARELRGVYTPGENVLPVVVGGDGGEDSGDERLLAQVRELSLAGVEEGRGGGRGAERRARRRRDYSGEGLSERRLREHDGLRVGEEGVQQLEHQPSLRSLVLASDAESSQEMQEEIMAHIVREGLLEGIDLEHLSPEQEEELTERIALAYQRRRRERERERPRSSGQQQQQQGRGQHSARRERSPVQVTAGATERSRHHRRNGSASNQPGAGRTRPPVSRPHIFEQAQQPSARNGRRSSSQSSPRTPRSAYNIDERATRTPAARSATDLSTRPRGEEVERERQSSRRSSTASRRTNTDPEGARGAARMYRQGSQSSTHLAGVGRRRSGLTGPSNNSTPSLTSQTQGSDDSTNTRQTVRPATSTAAFAPEPTSTLQQQPATQPGEIASTPPASSITCNRCDKPSIQHSLHYHCNKCSNRTYNICLSCYRGGQGCNHWFGFGYSALYRWQRAGPKEGWPPSYERPHVLTARRYHPTTHELEEGAFCDHCLTNANASYWHCTLCLEGAWGFCSSCVQRGHHCTHPLLPLAHIRSLQAPNHPDPTKTTFIPLPHLQSDTYVQLPIATDCDVCGNPIPPNNTRLHCYKCNEGNYDVCTPCYRGLAAQGKLLPRDGPNGWRRCPSGRGHRMAVLGFQDTGGVVSGQQLVVVRAVVGGWALKEDEDAEDRGQGGDGDGALGALLPPDGGVGLRCLALWSYFPASGVEDEVGFPKNAEVGEVELINEDWGWGVYAGEKGLFPMNHVRVL